MSASVPETDERTPIVASVRRLWEEYLPYWFMLPMVVTLLAFTLYPGLYNVYLSFVEYALTDPASIGDFNGLQNFETVFDSRQTWQSVRVTSVFVVSALVLETTLGFVLAALVTGVHHRIRSVYRVLFILPMAIAPVSLATISRIMLNSQVGVVPYLWEVVFPGQAPQFLGTSLALPTVILIEVWEWTPFMFIIFYAGLTSVPDDLVEAARVDGAPIWRIYTDVVIPYIKPLALVAILIRFIDLSRTFGLVKALTDGGPGNVTTLLSIHIFELGFNNLELGQAAALAIVYLVVIVVVSNLVIIVFGFRGVWR